MEITTPTMAAPRTGSCSVKKSQMTVIIRPAANDDLAALDDLFREGDAWHAAHEPTVFCVAHGEPRPHEYLQSIIAAEDSTILVAERAGQVVGMLVLIVHAPSGLPMLVPRRIGVVDTLIVAEGARRQGVGRRLMLAGEDWFRQHGCLDLQLNVFDFNTGAQALYRQLGYRPQSRRMAKRLTDG